MSVRIRAILRAEFERISRYEVVCSVRSGARDAAGNALPAIWKLFDPFAEKPAGKDLLSEPTTQVQTAGMLAADSRKQNNRTAWLPLSLLLSEALPHFVYEVLCSKKIHARR